MWCLETRQELAPVDPRIPQRISDLHRTINTRLHHRPLTSLMPARPVMEEKFMGRTIVLSFHG